MRLKILDSDQGLRPVHRRGQIGRLGRRQLPAQRKHRNRGQAAC